MLINYIINLVNLNRNYSLKFTPKFQHQQKIDEDVTKNLLFLCVVLLLSHWGYKCMFI